jgi:hypothetical protein
LARWYVEVAEQAVQENVWVPKTRPVGAECGTVALDANRTRHLLSASLVVGANGTIRVISGRTNR